VGDGVSSRGVSLCFSLCFLCCLWDPGCFEGRLQAFFDFVFAEVLFPLSLVLDKAGINGKAEGMA